ncbi:MAG TPA: 3'-5' exonuclease [Oligoflexus sp.]|uniref:3'-5' exonuclease n=1 Tax=Oligoflexus sp. TaxID=1971216 RepID=UPI002D2D6269|nr:3'-5' exonuclease [Oligoflexus sp.]HYX34365.1 3'-5' exonuclease [Oligoflexus sp.]
MQRRIHIAENFYDFVSELHNAIEIKQVQKAVRLIKDDPSNPGLRRHKLNRLKSDHVVSYSANQDIRIITYEPQSDEAYLLYVNHHDIAYNWVQTKKISKDLMTGALRLISIAIEEDVETPSENHDPSKIEVLPARNKGVAYLFDAFDNKALNQEGIPSSYVEVCRRIANEHDLMLVLDALPAAVGESVFNLATQLIQGYSEEPQQISPLVPPVVDTILTFQKIETDQELESWIRALDEAMQLEFGKWRSFLHPAQRKAVTANSSGPVRITGAAGTGKTVVGIHRSVHLKALGFRTVHLLTFNRTLMRNLMDIVKDVFGQELGKSYKVKTFHSYVLDRLKEERGLELQLGGTTEDFLQHAFEKIQPQHLVQSKETVELIFREIVDIIAAQQIRSVGDYIRAPRKGAHMTLTVEQKEELWAIYELAWQAAVSSQKIPYDLIAHYALDQKLRKLENDALVVDEVQDLKAVDLAFLAEQASGANQLTLLEDGKQRIYGPGYSLKSLGINVSGKRSIKLYVNYRTTDEISEVAHNSLMDHGLQEIDRPKSLRHGPTPETKIFTSQEKRLSWLIEAIFEQQKKGHHRLSVIARYRKSLEEIQAKLQAAGIDFQHIERENPIPEENTLSLLTMHNSKGLEFESVFVLDDKDHSKNQAPDWMKSNKKALLDYERKKNHLQYVALSRARDQLFILLL